MDVVMASAGISSVCKSLVAVTGGATIRFLRLVTTVLMIRKVAVILW